MNLSNTVKLPDNKIDNKTKAIPIMKNALAIVIILSIQNMFMANHEFTAIEIEIFPASGFSNADAKPVRIVGMISNIAILISSNIHKESMENHRMEFDASNQRNILPLVISVNCSRKPWFQYFI